MVTGKVILLIMSLQARHKNWFMRDVTELSMHAACPQHGLLRTRPSQLANMSVAVMCASASRADQAR
jgi:hypothetical protein